MENVPQEESTKAPTESKTSENKQAGNSEEVIDRWVLKHLAYSLDVNLTGDRDPSPRTVKITVAMFSSFDWE